MGFCKMDLSDNIANIVQWFIEQTLLYKLKKTMPENEAIDKAKKVLFYLQFIYNLFYLQKYNAFRLFEVDSFLVDQIRRRL